MTFFLSVCVWPVKVDILVTTGAEDGVLVDGDDAEIVGVLPQYLQLRHVGLVQLVLSVFHLERRVRNRAANFTIL